MSFPCVPTSNGRKFVCVFCGSADGSSPFYLEAAHALGHAIAQRGYGLVYGGASVGLMGAVADAVLAAGSAVVGVIPDVIVDREVGHRGLTELIVVRSMHERKARMAELSDAFVALPGGFGTMDEFLEILTWAQLHIHSKPCVLVNVEGYYDSLLRFFENAMGQGFLKRENRELVLVAAGVEEAMSLIEGSWGHRDEIPAHDLRLDRVAK